MSACESLKLMGSCKVKWRDGRFLRAGLHQIRLTGSIYDAISIRLPSGSRQ